MSDSDLSHHFKVLKQFLDISDDSSGRTKSNSSRAARAREKLLKLSSAQFCELSTDVFDELKRRIDESRSEPDFLLPRSTFHPKRNQARQKLSSLPQSRFKDLVSDISYEIERRDLHKPSTDKPKSNVPERHASHTASTQESTTSTNSQIQSKSRASNDESFEDSSVASSHKKLSSDHFTSPLRSHQTLDANNIANSTALSDDLSVPDKKDVVQKQAIGIQPTTVVPAKANMMWSSDEESDHADETDTNESEVPRRLSLSNTLNPSRSASSATNTDSKVGEPQVDNDNLLKKVAVLTSSHDQVRKDYEDAQSAHKSLVTDFNSLLEKYNDLSSQHADLQTSYDSIRAENDRIASDAAQNQSIKKELEDLKSTNASLRLENQSLKTERKRFSLESRDISSPSNAGTRGRSGSFVAQEAPLTFNIGEQNSSSSHDMNAELRKLHERLDQVPMRNSSRPDSRKVEQLRNEVSQWQKKFESLKSDQILQSYSSQSVRRDLKIYSSPNGLVPLKLAARFFSLTESFFLALETSHPDSDLLFEKISSIAIAANKISLQGDNNAVGGNRHADTIRNAASHALTATRYYATHSNIMPKIIVERAVAEVAFSVCDTLSVFKLQTDGDLEADTTISPLKGRIDHDDDFASMAKPLRITPRTQQISEPINVDGELNDHKLESSNPQSQNSFIQNHVQSKSPITPTHNTPSSKEESVVQSKGLFGKSEPKLEKPVTQDSVSTETIIETSPVTPQKPSKLSILNKMKQFERPSASTQPTNKDIVSSKENASSPSSEHSISQDTSENASKASKETAESAPARSKSIFQSLRDRFTSDNTTTPAEEASESKSIKEDSDIPNSKEFKDTSSIKEAVPSSAPVLANGKSSLVTGSAEPVEKNFVPEVVSNTKDESDLDAAPPKITLREVTKPESLDNKEQPSSVASQKADDALQVKQEDDVIAPLNRNDQAPESSDTVVPEQKAESPEEDKFTGTESDSSAKKGAEEATVERSLSAEKKSAEVASQSNDTSNVSFGSSSFGKQSETDGQKSAQPTEPAVSKSVQSPESAVSKSASTSNSASQSSINSFAQRKNSFKVKKVNYQEPLPEPDVKSEEDEEEEEEDSYDEEEDEIRQRQDYRKSMAAATFNFDLFDIDDPDNTLTQVLLYLEHQTVQVISTIQDLLSAIKKPDATRGELRENSGAISEVIRQMTEATNTSMNQTRNHQLKEHGSWVVKSLDDCNHRMHALCKPNSEKDDSEFADRHFKQRLAGISFDIAKCTKELVKTVEEASLKEDIAHLDAKLSQADDLT